MSSRSPHEFESIASMDPLENLHPFTFHLSGKMPQPRSCSDVKEPTLNSQHRSKSMRSQVSQISQISQFRKSALENAQPPAEVEEAEDNSSEKPAQDAKQSKYTSSPFTRGQTRVHVPSARWKLRLGLSKISNLEELVRAAVTKFKVNSYFWSTASLNIKIVKYLQERYCGDDQLWAEDLLQGRMIYMSIAQPTAYFTLIGLLILYPFSFINNIPQILMYFATVMALLPQICYLLNLRLSKLWFTTFTIALMFLLIALVFAPVLIEYYLFPLLVIFSITFAYINDASAILTSRPVLILTMQLVFYLYVHIIACYDLMLSNQQSDYLTSLYNALSYTTPFSAGVFTQSKGQMVLCVLVQIVNVSLAIAFVAYRSEQKSSSSNPSQQKDNNESEISYLPIQVRRKMYLNVRQHFTKNLKLFKAFEKATANELTIAMTDHFTRPQEIIVKKNQRNTPFMYILCQGRVQLYDEPVVFNNDLQRVPVASLKEGDIFGHECFFNSKGHEYTAKSLTFTKLLRLDYDTFYSIIKSSRKDLVSSKSQLLKEKFHQMRNEVVYNDDYSQIFLQCTICYSSSHLATYCPKLHYIPDKDLMRLRMIYSSSMSRKFITRGRTQQINTLLNLKKIKECGKIFQQDFDFSVENSEEFIDGSENYEDQIKQHSNDNEKNYSYKDLLQTQTSKPVSSNIDKQRSNTQEVYSGQTLKEIQYENSIRPENDEEEFNNNNQKSENINRIQPSKPTLGTMGIVQHDLHRTSIAKGTLQTAGFNQVQAEDFQPQFNINNGDFRQFYDQPKNPTQNSNTYKSSSSVPNSHPNSHHSQKSQTKQQQYAISPDISPNTNNSANSQKIRVAQPKLTFQYNPETAQSPGIEKRIQNNLQSTYSLSPQEIPYYANWLRQQNRSSTNYVNYIPNSGLAIVSEESSSNIAGVPLPVNSAMSISSVGHQPSIDDQIARGRDRSVGRNTFRNQTNISNVSPGKTSREGTPITDKRKSNSGTGTYSHLRPGSNIFDQSQSRLQYQSDFENAHNFYQDFDIDRMQNYQNFLPHDNVQHVLDRLTVKRNVQERMRSTLMKNTPSQSHIP